MAHPRLREAFLEMTKFSEALIPGTPALKERGLFVRSAGDLMRPEIIAAQRRLSQVSRRDSSVAVIPGDGATKARAERQKGGAEDIYLIHPVLGPYPKELEYHYPFSQTEIGDMVPLLTPSESVRRIRKLGYRMVKTDAAESQPRTKVRNTRTRRDPSPSPRSSSAHSR